ncbi:MAG: NUDIX hydrolase [Burkholderiaceae bacterium]|nr:NUDIX hydrolase [Burkholderiaceae bacterium]
MARDLRETRIDSEVVFRGSFLEVRRDRVRLPDGQPTSREYVVHPGAAAMVPVFADQRVLIERQFRYPLGTTFVEVPAGKLDPGESALQTARRELVEETGYRAREWAFLTRLHTAIGFSDEVIDVFLCRDLVHTGQHLDDGEFLEIEIVTLGWLIDELRAGRLTDVKTQIVTFWLERFFSGAWPWPAFERHD